MDNEKLKSETEFLFNRDWEEDLPDKEAEAVEDRAADLIAVYGCRESSRLGMIICTLNAPLLKLS